MTEPYGYLGEAARTPDRLVPAVSWYVQTKEKALGAINGIGNARYSREHEIQQEMAAGQCGQEQRFAMSGMLGDANPKYQASQLESRLPANPSQPQEPGLVARAVELIGHLGELSSNVETIRERLLGSSTSADMSKAHAPASLESMIAMACERVAGLVGETFTILNRL